MPQARFGMYEKMQLPGPDLWGPFRGLIWKPSNACEWVERRSHAWLADERMRIVVILGEQSVDDRWRVLVRVSLKEADDLIGGERHTAWRRIAELGSQQEALDAAPDLFAAHLAELRLQAE